MKSALSCILKRHANCSVKISLYQHLYRGLLPVLKNLPQLPVGIAFKYPAEKPVWQFKIDLIYHFCSFFVYFAEGMHVLPHLEPAREHFVDVHVGLERCYFRVPVASSDRHACQPHLCALRQLVACRRSDHLELHFRRRYHFKMTNICVELPDAVDVCIDCKRVVEFPQLLTKSNVCLRL